MLLQLMARLLTVLIPNDRIFIFGITYQKVQIIIIDGETEFMDVTLFFGSYA